MCVCVCVVCVCACLSALFGSPGDWCQISSVLVLTHHWFWIGFLVPPSTMQISLPVPLSKQEPEWKFVRQQKKGEVILLESPVRVKLAKRRLVQRFFEQVLGALSDDASRVRSLVCDLVVVTSCLCVCVCVCMCMCVFLFCSVVVRCWCWWCCSRC
jgi:hypothetical protein